jgi:hypothetical protein
LKEGAEGAVKEYIIPVGSDQNRVAKLASVLRSQGVEVKRAEAVLRNASANSLDEQEYPAGTLVISLDQPAGRLIRTLLDPHVSMGKEFIREQLRRIKRRDPDQIYDVTSWSLPLLYGVEVHAARSVSDGPLERFEDSEQLSGGVVGAPAKVAYLIPWGKNSSAQVLADLLANKVKVFFTEESLSMKGINFPSGSLIVKVKDNPGELQRLLDRIGTERGVRIHATDTGWVDKGVNLGSNQVHYLKPPNIALVWGEPTQAYSAGWTRYVLEQMYGFQTTVITARTLLSGDLSRYNVLILPNLNSEHFASVMGESGTARVRSWVGEGGTLVALRSASNWLTRAKVGLLATQHEMRNGTTSSDSAASPPEDQHKTVIEPEEELPAPTAGAILKVNLDCEHWLAAGYSGPVHTIFEGRHIFSPLKLDKGRNVGLFADESEVVASGFVLDEVAKQLAGKAYLMYQSHGKGHVVAFAQDPNFRAYFDGLNLLFLNPVVFGPAK